MFLQGENKKEYFCWFLLWVDGRRLPHIHKEKITQVFFVSLWVKCDGAIEEGHSAICLDKNDFIERFFLPRAPGCDDVIVDFWRRYHCMIEKKKEEKRISIFQKEIKKSVFVFFYFFDVYGFLI